MCSFPDVKEKEEMRKIIGRYGLTGREQVKICFFIRIKKLLAAKRTIF